MRTKSKSFQGRYPTNVQLEMLERRQLLSSIVMGVGKFTVAPRPTAAAVTATDSPSYKLVMSSSDQPLVTAAPVGYTPSQIAAAYGLDQVTFGSIVGDGAGQTIAIIDAYNDPTIQNDLRGFDTAFNLPTGQLTVENQSGGTVLPPVDPAGAGNVDGNFEVEEALDVEWAHALAPGAQLLLIEANDSSPVNLFAAANFARQQDGVSVVSMSFGGNEISSQTQYDSVFTTPVGHTGVTFLASTGDNGEPGGYPAYSPNVVAVGGTTLAVDSLGNYLGETGWSGSGGGISQVEPQPSYQDGTVTQSGTKRTIPDVSFDADPLTGVPIYDSYNQGTGTPWEQIGGTSFAAPAWAAMIAVTDEGRVIDGEGTLDGATQTLPMIYSAPAADFHDITSGNNGFSAGPGYDLVTGRGSPQANLLVQYLVTGTNAPPTSTGPTVTSIVASGTTVAAGAQLTLTAEGVGDPGATGVAVTFYEESNGVAGLQVGVGGDTPVGAAQTAAPYSVTLDTTNLAGDVKFYAQVTDSSGDATAINLGAVSVVVDVVSPNANRPTLAAITATPNPIVTGQKLTLQAVGFTEPAGSEGVERRVDFYEETNGVAGLQTGPGGDLELQEVSASTNYSLTLDTTGITGIKTFYAVAMDSDQNFTAKGTSAPAVSVTITGNALPDAPVSLTATPLSTTSVALTFQEANSGQVGFEIQRALEPSFTTFVTLFTINRPNISTYTDTGLLPGTRYFYRVEAFDNAGDSPFSLTAQATTLFTPAKLGFAEQPLNQQAGAAPRAIVVNVETPSGGVSPIDNSNVTLSILSGPAGATISGTLTVQAAGGVATFTDVVLTKVGTYKLLATDSDLSIARSLNFTVSPETGSAHLVLVRQPSTVVVGVKGTPAYVVDLVDQFGNLETTAKAKVRLSVADGPSFLPQGTTTVSLKKGVGTLSDVILPAAGNYVLDLTDLTFGSSVVVDEAVAIATTRITTPKSVTTTVGKNLTITAKLTSNAPSKVPFGGSVTLESTSSPVNPNVLVADVEAIATLAAGTVSANGTVKFNLAGVPAGTYSDVQVAYAGDVSHTAVESAAFTLVVKPVLKKIVLTPSATHVAAGASVTLTAKFTGLINGAVVPTGTVTFQDAGTTLGTVDLTNGVASFVVGGIAAGSHLFTATYSGDSNYDVTVSSIAHVVATGALENA
jgi:hypothetical protein